MEFKQVTLATLATSTAQEVFDWVVSNLLRQGRKSNIVDPSNKLRSERCLYRGPEGTKCAAGWLMADEEYQPVFDDEAETTSWSSLVSRRLVSDHCKSLIEELQKTHDRTQPTNWVSEFRLIANSYGLEFKFEQGVSECA